MALDLGTVYFTTSLRLQGAFDGFRELKAFFRRSENFIDIGVRWRKGDIAKMIKDVTEPFGASQGSVGESIGKSVTQALTAGLSSGIASAAKETNASLEKTRQIAIQSENELAKQREAIQAKSAEQRKKEIENDIQAQRRAQQTQLEADQKVRVARYEARLRDQSERIKTLEAGNRSEFESAKRLQERTIELHQELINKLRTIDKTNAAENERIRQAHFNSIEKATTQHLATIEKQQKSSDAALVSLREQLQGKLELADQKLEAQKAKWVQDEIKLRQQANDALVALEKKLNDQLRLAESAHQEKAKASQQAHLETLERKNSEHLRSLEAQAAKSDAVLLKMQQQLQAQLSKLEANLAAERQKLEQERIKNREDTDAKLLLLETKLQARLDSEREAHDARMRAAAEKSLSDIERINQQHVNQMERQQKASADAIESLRANLNARLAASDKKLLDERERWENERVKRKQESDDAIALSEKRLRDRMDQMQQSFNDRDSARNAQHLEAIRVANENHISRLAEQTRKSNDALEKQRNDLEGKIAASERKIEAEREKWNQQRIAADAAANDKLLQLRTKLEAQLEALALRSDKRIEEQNDKHLQTLERLNKEHLDRIEQQQKKSDIALEKQRADLEDKIAKSDKKLADAQIAWDNERIRRREEANEKLLALETKLQGQLTAQQERADERDRANKQRHLDQIESLNTRHLAALTEQREKFEDQLRIITERFQAKAEKAEQKIAMEREKRENEAVKRKLEFENKMIDLEARLTKQMQLNDQLLKLEIKLQQQLVNLQAAADEKAKLQKQKHLDDILAINEKHKKSIEVMERRYQLQISAIEKKIEADREKRAEVEAERQARRQASAAARQQKAAEKQRAQEEADTFKFNARMSQQQMQEELKRKKNAERVIAERGKAMAKAFKAEEELQQKLSEEAGKAFGALVKPFDNNASAAFKLFGTKAGREFLNGIGQYEGLLGALFNRMGVKGSAALLTGLSASLPSIRNLFESLGTKSGNVLLEKIVDALKGSGGSGGGGGGFIGVLGAMGDSGGKKFTMAIAASMVGVGLKLGTQFAKEFSGIFITMMKDAFIKINQLGIEVTKKIIQETDKSVDIAGSIDANSQTASRIALRQKETRDSVGKTISDAQYQQNFVQMQEQFRKQAIELGADASLVVKPSEVAEAQKKLATSGKSADFIKNSLKRIIQIANITQQDLTTTVDNVLDITAQTDFEKGFNMSDPAQRAASEKAQADSIGQIFGAVASGRVNLADIGETLKYTRFGDGTAKSLTQQLELASLNAQSGLRGSVAGTAISSFVENVEKLLDIPGFKPDGAFKGLELEKKNEKGETVAKTELEIIQQVVKLYNEVKTNSNQLAKESSAKTGVTISGAEYVRRFNADVIKALNNRGFNYLVKMANTDIGLGADSKDLAIAKTFTKPSEINKLLEQLSAVQTNSVGSGKRLLEGSIESLQSQVGFKLAPIFDGFYKSIGASLGNMADPESVFFKELQKVENVSKLMSRKMFGEMVKVEKRDENNNVVRDASGNAVMIDKWKQGELGPIMDGFRDSLLEAITELREFFQDENNVKGLVERLLAVGRFLKGAFDFGASIFKGTVEIIYNATKLINTSKPIVEGMRQMMIDIFPSKEAMDANFKRFTDQNTKSQAAKATGNSTPGILATLTNGLLGGLGSAGAQFLTDNGANIALLGTQLLQITVSIASFIGQIAGFLLRIVSVITALLLPPLNTIVSLISLLISGFEGFVRIVLVPINTSLAAIGQTVTSLFDSTFGRFNNFIASFNSEFNVATSQVQAFLTSRSESVLTSMTNSFARASTSLRSTLDSVLASSGDAIANIDWGAPFRTIKESFKSLKALVNDIFFLFFGGPAIAAEVPGSAGAIAPKAKPKDDQSFFGKMASGFNSFMSSVPATILAMFTNPWGAAIAGLRQSIGVVANQSMPYLQAASTNTVTVVSAGWKAWETSVRTSVAWIANQSMSFLQSSSTATVDVVKTAWKGWETATRESIGWIANQSMPFLQNATIGVVNAIKNAWNAVWTWIRETISWLVTQSIPFLFGAATAAMSSFNSFVEKSFKWIRDTIAWIANQSIPFLQNAATGMIDSVNKFWDKSWKWIRTTFSELANSLKKFFEPVFNFFTEKLEGIINKAKEFMAMAGGGIGGAIGGVGGGNRESINLAAIAILEAGYGKNQGQVDVATSILNRAQGNFSGYGKSVRDQIYASGQYEPFFGVAKGTTDTKDGAASHIAKKLGITKTQAMAEIDKFFANAANKAMVDAARSLVGARTDFKGTSEYPNMKRALGDVLRQNGDNFFHYTPGTSASQWQQAGRLDQFMSSNAGSGVLGAVGNTFNSVKNAVSNVFKSGVKFWSTGDGGGSSVINSASQIKAHHDYQYDKQGRYVVDFTLEDGQGRTRGVPVPAPAAGKVVKAGDYKDGYGNSVDILTADGQTILIGHLDSVAVRVGQSIGAGTVVGGQGSTGQSSGDHVHMAASKRIIDDYVNAVAGKGAGGGDDFARYGVSMANSRPPIVENMINEMTRGVTGGGGVHTTATTPASTAAKTVLSQATTKATKTSTAPETTVTRDALKVLQDLYKARTTPEFDNRGLSFGFMDSNGVLPTMMGLPKVSLADALKGYSTEIKKPVSAVNEQQLKLDKEIEAIRDQLSENKKVDVLADAKAKIVKLQQSLNDATAKRKIINQQQSLSIEEYNNKLGQRRKSIDAQLAKNKTELSDLYTRVGGKDKYDQQNKLFQAARVKAIEAVSKEGAKEQEKADALNDALDTLKGMQGEVAARRALLLEAANREFKAASQRYRGLDRDERLADIQSKQLLRFGTFLTGVDRSIAEKEFTIASLTEQRTSLETNRALDKKQLDLKNQSQVNSSNITIRNLEQQIAAAKKDLVALEQKQALQRKLEALEDQKKKKEENISNAKFQQIEKYLKQQGYNPTYEDVLKIYLRSNALETEEEIAPSKLDPNVRRALFEAGLFGVGSQFLKSSEGQKLPSNSVRDLLDSSGLYNSMGGVQFGGGILDTNVRNNAIIDVSGGGLYSTNSPSRTSTGGGGTKTIRFEFDGIDESRTYSGQQIQQVQAYLNSPVFVDDMTDSVIERLKYDSVLRSRLGIR